MKKPEYRIPPMADILAIPDNGLRVASLFSGCGGSSLGYRLAGFRIIWANEYNRHAAATYRANFPNTPLDSRDICNIEPGELPDIDVLDGSPPCQSFSMSGKRRVDDPHASLFGEFARLLAGLRPRVFVAENVPGMAGGRTRGIFKETVAMLRGCGYAVGVRKLDAQWLGVPQARQRLFFVGVRDDLAFDPPFPDPLPYRHTLAEACPGILRHGTSMDWDKFRSNLGADPGKTAVDSRKHPSPTITSSGPHVGAGFVIELDDGYASRRPGDKTIDPMREPHPTIRANRSISLARGTHGCRRFSIQELKRICSFPDDFELAGTYAQQWARLGDAVPPVMMFHQAHAIAGALLCTKKKAKKETA